MRLEFPLTTSLAEFRRAQRLHLRKTRVIFLGLFLCLAVVSLTSGNRALAVSGTSMVVLWLLWVEVVMPYVTIPINYRRSTLAQGEFQVRVDDEWFIVTSPGAESKIKWENYRAYKDDRHLFILYLTADTYQIIPKRCLTAEQQAEFGGFLRETFSRR